MVNPYKTQATYPELRINDTFDLNACPIAAVEYVGFSPNKVINTIVKDSDVYENSPSFYTTEILKNDSSGTFPVSHYTYFNDPSANQDYLVTNITTVGQTQTPLFYQYELLFNAQIQEDAGSISVYKNNEILLSTTSYLVQYSYDLLGTFNRYSSTSWGLRDISQAVHRVRLLLPMSLNGSDFYTVVYNRSLYNAVTSQTELVEMVPLYTSLDFSVTSSGVSVSGLLNSGILQLYLTKEPSSRLSVVGIDPPDIQHDNITSWYLRVTPGSFYVTPGEFNNISGNFYNLLNNYNPTLMPIVNIVPSFISNDVIKVDQTPIYITESLYTYPLYTISGYDPLLISLSAATGSVGILVNGLTVPGLAVKSIDRNKGYIQLNQTLDPTDSVALTFYVDSSKYLILDNLELNPKISGSTALFNISGYMEGLGIAIPPYSGAVPNSQLLYLYDPTVDPSTRVCYSIPPVGGPLPVASGWMGGNFISLCELSLNRLSKDMVKITDARRIGGGVDRKMLETAAIQVSGLNMHELDWYSNVGFYGGEPLAIGSSVVIHIPSGVLFGMRDKWIASMSGIAPDDITAIDSRTRAFNTYLDQVIKRYVSAGTNYVIIPINEDGSLGNILNMDI